VGVRSVDSSEVRAERLQNVLTNGRMSTASSVLLQQRGLEDVWLEQPEAALAVLHEGVLDSPQRAEVLASLAELSYLLALRTESKERYLATVVYAWLVLFPEDLSLDHSRLDPRRRLMADLYNGALADALLPPDHTTLTGLESRHLLPFIGSRRSSTRTASGFVGCGTATSGRASDPRSSEPSSLWRSSPGSTSRTGSGCPPPSSCSSTTPRRSSNRASSAASSRST
jgi:hypothetical protein